MERKKTSKKNRWYSARIHANLMRCYERASDVDRNEGLSWYQRAHETCVLFAHRYNITLEASAGIVAALSPGSAWDKNLSDADTFLQEWRKGARGRRLPLVGSYGWKNVIKASLIAAGRAPLDILGGRKVRAFYRCILDPSNASDVCVDRHAKSAAIGERLSDSPTKERIGRFIASTSVRASEYSILEKHYRRAAGIVGILPHQFQATVWVTWRRLSGKLDLSTEAPF